MPRVKTNHIPFTPRWSIGSSEKARSDAMAIQKVVGNARSSVTSDIKHDRISEAKIAEAVAKYFSDSKFSKFFAVRECEIQVGPAGYKADVVLCDTERNFIAIAECRSPKGSNSGQKLLKSYLCATDTPYGIFASSTNRDSWIFYENLRHNRFRQIKCSDFEKNILK